MSHKRSVVLFIAASLDGYIATKDDTLEWLFEVEGEGDNGYTEFYNTVDTILMGKRTYDWIITQASETFPYAGKRCFVFTRSNFDDTEHVKFINDDIEDSINKLKSEKGQNIWLVGGGELLHTFIQDGLVDEFIITIAPVILGNGIPLFKEGDHQANLILKSTRTFNQFVELHYEVRK